MVATVNNIYENVINGTYTENIIKEAIANASASGGLLGGADYNSKYCSCTSQAFCFGGEPNINKILATLFRGELFS